MNIDKEALRTRRLELGITKRELGKACGVSVTVISRLEEIGDASTLQVQTLVTLLHNLSLELVNVIHYAAKEETGSSTIDASELGQLLFSHGRVMPRFQISACLGIPLEEVDSAIEELDSRLKPTGLRINQTQKGIRIVPSAQSPHTRRATEEARRTRSFEVLNHGDLSLLYRAMKAGLPANVIAGRNNGNVSLHKLENANLIRIEKGVLVLTDQTLTSLGREQSKTK